METMWKARHFPNTRFAPDTIRSAISRASQTLRTASLDAYGQDVSPNGISHELYIREGQDESSYFEIERWLAVYRRLSPSGSALMRTSIPFDGQLQLQVDRTDSIVRVTHPTEERIEAVLAVFEEAPEHAGNTATRTTASPTHSGSQEPIQPSPIRVFVAHGRSSSWRSVADALRDDHGLEVLYFESLKRAGMTVNQVLETALGLATHAIAVMTAEDHLEGGIRRSRQNVIHEIGLFHGRLGFDRVIILHEASVERFSNMEGIIYIPFDANSPELSVAKIIAALDKAV